MPTYALRPQPLSHEAFAQFGEVVCPEHTRPLMINNGNTERYDSLAKVALASAADQAVISIFRAQARALPMRITMMEKHPLGSQSFHPLSGQPYLILVADPGKTIAPENLHLFMARADQGVNYHQDTWHHPILALNHTCDFLVVDRKGEGKNCDEYFFPSDLDIRIHA